MAVSTEKGLHLEYEISGLFQSQGYLTRRGVPLQYGDKNVDATDIDVLGTLFTPPFQAHSIICDCKNKKNSKPYERIFWAKGLGQFVKASDIYVSLPHASWDVVKFASNGNVRILTTEIVQDYNKKNPVKYGLSDDNFYAKYFDDINNILKSNKDLVKYWNAMKKLYINEDPYVSVNIAMELLLMSGRNMEYYSKNESKGLYTFWKHICCECIVMIGLRILNICSDTMFLPVKARENHILSKLTFGEMRPNQVKEILENAKNIANEIVKANIPKSDLPKSNIIEFGEISPPVYASSIVGLVERAIQNPEWYINLPQILDFVLFEYAVKNKEFSLDTYKKVFNSSLADEKLKAAKNIIFFVKNTCRINLKLIWDKPETFLIKKDEKVKSDSNIDNKPQNISIDELISKEKGK